MYLQTNFPINLLFHTYQIVNMQFGMYFYIPTVFLIIKNTYHFVNYQFSMYLQTNFPIILLFHTYQIANTPVWYVFYRCSYCESPLLYIQRKITQNTFSHILHSFSLHLILPHAVSLHLHSEFRILNSEFFLILHS